MLASGPNFSPFPFDRVPRVTRRDAAIESALARWLAPGRLGAKLAALVGGAVRARFLGVVPRVPDPHAARAELRLGGMSITLAGSARPVRALAQRLLGGPAELDAARPLTVAEHAIWALAVAAALADLGVAGEVWPLEGTGAGAAPLEATRRASEAGEGPREATGRASDAAERPQEPTRRGSDGEVAPHQGPRGASDDGDDGDDGVLVGFCVELPAGLGAAPMTVTARLPPDVVLRVPPARLPHAWRFDLPIVVARCALPPAGIARLAVRDVITVESHLALVLGGGEIGLSAPPGAVEARVATEYVARDMALVDDAHLEVTVQLGTTRLSLRQLGELAIGQIVALGRPLAGPYEVRAAGRVVGQGELVDIDGELGVRIVSIADQPDQE